MACGGASPASLGQARTGFSLCLQGGVGGSKKITWPLGQHFLCPLPAGSVALRDDTASSGPQAWNTNPASTLRAPSLCGPAPS